MSIITVEFDNTLSQTEIVMPIISSSASEAGEEYNNTLSDKAQTKVFGIQSPLIMINSTVIDFDAVHQFSLRSEGVLPELSMIVEDRYQIIENIDKPKLDNEVRVQILPKFDDAYKKIDLTFYITSINVNGALISLTCMYKAPTLTSSQFKTFGEIDTYSLFKTVANDTCLGFATNIAELTDNRYIYCDNKSFLDIMNEEIQFANCNEHILDYWIDLWNNINLADIKERYESIDSNEDIMIWVAGQVDEVTIDKKIEPVQVPAVLISHPAFTNYELYASSYDIINKPGTFVANGSDKVYSIYETAKGEYIDYFLQNGDVQKDIFQKYEYLGENYGEYNYLIAKKIRESYIQKIGSEQIKVTLKSPLLALMRGHKVNFIRYVNNDIIENKIKAIEDEGFIDRNIESNIPLQDFEIETDTDNGKFVIDKTVSGQYLITGLNAMFKTSGWEYTLTLSRPPLSYPNILKKE